METKFQYNESSHGKSIKLEAYDPDTGTKIIIKNIDYIVYYHNSDKHDPNRFEKIEDQIFNGNQTEINLLNKFYKLAENLI